MLVLQAELDELKQQFEDLQYDDPSSRALGTLKKQIEEREQELSKLGMHLASIGMDKKYGPLQTPESDKENPGKSNVSPYSTGFSEWLDKWTRQADPLKAKLKDISAELNRAKGNLDRALSGKGDYTQTEIKHLEIIKGYLEDQKENLEEQLKIRKFMNAEFITNPDYKPDIKNYETVYTSTSESGGTKGFSSAEILFEKIGESITPVLAPFKKVGESLSGFGSMFTSLEGMGSFFTDIFKEMGPLISSISSINKLLNPLQTILAAAMKTIGPVLNSLLKPLLGALQIIGVSLGKVIAPVLKILEPVITLVSKAFIWLYNFAIRPFGNAVIWLVTTINNAVANVMNAIIWALNKIPFVHIKWRMNKMSYEDNKLDKISQDDLNAYGNDSLETTGISGTGASYTAGSSTTVNIVINTEVIAGESGIRDLALMIRNEISAAEALGY